MDLCGHATLATAHCLVKHLGYKSNKIKFETLSGILEVSIENGTATLDTIKINTKEFIEWALKNGIIEEDTTYLRAG